MHLKLFYCLDGKKKKRISLSLLIFFQLFPFFFSPPFYFASHYYSASRRTTTFLMRSSLPILFNRLQKYFSLSLISGDTTHSKDTDRLRTELDEREIVIKRAIILFFFFPSNIRLSNGYVTIIVDRVQYRKPQTAHCRH